MDDFAREAGGNNLRDGGHLACEDTFRSLVTWRVKHPWKPAALAIMPAQQRRAHDMGSRRKPFPIQELLRDYATAACKSGKPISGAIVTELHRDGLGQRASPVVTSLALATRTRK